MKTTGLILGAAFLLGACATPNPSPDAQLSARVKQEIAQTEGIGGARSVKVESAKGVVILSGFIGTEKQKSDAGQTALKVSGVQQVFNNLQVINRSSGE
ncbi:BON domain-containing protein [Noviherbaspirillum sp. ST9]|uniref:BON domain-containing protein n=1 Tax=Noviherbaspirillum sp. ST9 TaxID=3401606 RepID=UPI003B58B0C4